MFNDEALKSIREYLLSKEERIAVAESVTSGFLQASFSSVPDASQFFHGGITTYNLGQKCRHLSVSAVQAEKCNCVSSRVAAEMALHVCRLFSSEWGVAVTGYASKVPEGDNKLYAHYAIAFGNEIVATNVTQSTIEEGEETQLHFVNEVLSALQQHVKKH